MDKHLGVFITLMNSHLHVSLNYAFNMIKHHVTHPRAWATGGMWGIMYMGCATDVVEIEIITSLEQWH